MSFPSFISQSCGVIQVSFLECCDSFFLLWLPSLKSLKKGERGIVRETWTGALTTIPRWFLLFIGIEKDGHSSMFLFLQVIPPKGYRARRRGYDLSKVIIGTPIRQHAIGTSGTYQAILVEQPPMTGAEFEEMASSPDVLPPKKGHKEDIMLERRFWSAVTVRKWNRGFLCCGAVKSIILGIIVV